MSNTLLTTFSFSSKSGTKTGTSYEVISFDFGLSQNYDASNKPSGLPFLNIINIIVKASNDTTFFDWMKSATAEKHCIVELKLSESETRTIKMIKAYCVRYSESIDNHSGSGLLVDAGIIAKELHVNNIIYKSQSET